MITGGSFAARNVSRGRNTKNVQSRMDARIDIFASVTMFLMSLGIKIVLTSMM